MRFWIVAAVILHIVLVASGRQAFGWSSDEHLRLGDSVFQSALRALDLDDANLGDLNFGRICAEYAATDLSSDRFHEYGQPILKQLRHLTKDRIEQYRRIAITDIDDQASREPTSFPARNVVEGFLIHHIIALRLADSAARDVNRPFLLHRALRFEAMAQGYLADAFSAAHLLVPAHQPLGFLQRRNIIEAHNFHRDRGVYAVNALGDIWQTFGDDLLEWYEPTFRAVFAASVTSLKEVLAATLSRNPEAPNRLMQWCDSIAKPDSWNQCLASWLQDGSGEYYARDARLPSLLHIPMPVSATWSRYAEDPGEIDVNGYRRRYHYPQLADPGMHDTDLDGIDASFLFSGKDVVPSMIPAPFRNLPPAMTDSLVRHDPAWASVRWIQTRYRPPSFRGLLLHAGFQHGWTNRNHQSAATAGLGYGILDEFLVFRNFSLDALVISKNSLDEDFMLLMTSGFGIKSPLPSILRAFHLEVGGAVGFPGQDGGATIGLGLDGQVLPLRVTYAGVTMRVMYRVFYLSQTIKAFNVELILH
jgi:hypothetical protein